MAESQGERDSGQLGGSGKETVSGKRHPCGTVVKGALDPRGHSISCSKIILRTLATIRKEGKVLVT